MSANTLLVGDRRQESTPCHCERSAAISRVSWCDLAVEIASLRSQ
jgi:hypothetical protein